MRKVFCIITTLCLALTMLGAGYLFDAYVPPVTKALTFVFCNDDDSPFDRGELVQAAEATREYTFGNHDVTELRQVLVSINQEAKTEFSKIPESSIMMVDEEYTIDKIAQSHLDDVHKVATVARIFLIVMAVLSLVGMIIVGFMSRARGLGAVFIWAGVLLLLGLIAAAAFAIVDFSSFFALFHSMFFDAGSWYFNPDSLLICMFPEGFWVAMGIIWVIISAVLAIIFIIIGAKLRKRHPKPPKASKREAETTAIESVGAYEGGYTEDL